MATTHSPTPNSTTLSVKGYGWVLWLTVFANSLFFIWQCLDRYLVPRFLFLSLALVVALVALRKPLLERANWRLHGFDAFMLGWYGLNLASAFYAWHWSEGIFFAQKTLLLFGCYWLFRQLLHMDSAGFRYQLARIGTGLTWVVSLILLGQIGLALSESGLDNDKLYAYASGVFGNKGLASDFLFFLLVLQVWLKDDIKSNTLFYTNLLLLLGLILALQTRTVYLATALCALYYSVARYGLDGAFRPAFLRRWLPIGALALLGLAGLALRGGGSLGDRLNPLTYLESASANERRFVWYKTDLLNADHYWWGVGNGSWKFWLPSKTLEGAYRLQEKGIVFTRAHNDYLEIRAEMGMIGAVYFIALFVLAALSLVWALRQRAAGTPVHEVLAVGAGLLGYCFIQYFDFPRERIEMQVLLALFFAAAVHYGRGFWEKMPGVLLPSGVRMALLGGLVIGFLYNAVIGYYRVQGEIHNVKMALAYQKHDYATILKEAKAAQNPFYAFNDVTLPFEWHIGTAYYKLGKVSEGLQAFEAATRLNPFNFQVLNNYATALAANKQYEASIPYLEKALYINPKYDEGKFNLAFIYTELGDYNQAKHWLSKVDTIPNPKTPDELKKNKTILDNLANFKKNILKKEAQQ